ncbi:MAG: DNA polymerase Y family protein [Christensenellales bacterium]
METILHCDLNNFYASVECLFDPALKKVPMAVGGDESRRHGIVLAKNELAKGFGVITAETLYSARRKCPNLVVVPPHFERYQAFSEQVREIYGRYTPLCEPFGLDECWLDLSGTELFGQQAGDLLRECVKDETGLSISVGVSYNKVFAKLGSDMRKPDATTVISRQDYREKIWPLPVEAMLFVGRKSARRLKGIGIYTIGALAGMDVSLLSSLFGKNGIRMHRYANGEDKSAVWPYTYEREAKSVGNGLTAPYDLKDLKQAKELIYPLCEKVSQRLRAAYKKCGGVGVQIKGRDFKRMNRQKSFREPTWLCSQLAEAVVELVAANWDFATSIRALQVRAFALSDCACEQLTLFTETGLIRQEQLEQTLCALRARFGDGCVMRGVAVQSKLYPHAPGFLQEYGLA